MRPKQRRKPKKIVYNLNCSLCESGVKEISYKDVYRLKRFTSVRGKIISAERLGTCAMHQRQVVRAIKRARYMGLLL